MSAQVKKAGRIGTKIVAAILFVFLVMFNVQVGMHSGETSDVSLFGLELSIFVPSALATGNSNTCYDSGTTCHFWNINCQEVWRCNPNGACFEWKIREPYDPGSC